ncbi:MAG: hypothetical protein ABIP66_17645 [Gemmatimonadaceae bacterium]
MSDQTYDDGRARNLEALLRVLAERIRALDERGELLKHAAQLQQLMGDVRSELFHYEVRCTYDTPEIAEHRRIIAEAADTHEESWQSNPWTKDEDEDEEKTP